jgi:hypothetical protein
MPNVKIPMPNPNVQCQNPSSDLLGFEIGNLALELYLSFDI